MELDLEQIKEILDAFEDRNMQKLELKKGDFEITLERSPASGDVIQSYIPHPHPHPMHQPALPMHMPQEKSMSESPAAAEDTSGTYITSPMVGTFYAAPAPEEPAFVKVGDTVKAGQVVCIIEAMKVMNEVKSTESGVIKEILVENGHPLEFGSKIFKVG